MNAKQKYKWEHALEDTYSDLSKCGRELRNNKIGTSDAILSSIDSIKTITLTLLEMLEGEL